MTTRSAVMQVGCKLPRSGSSQGRPLSHRVVGEEAISALTRLYCEMKLHSMEADSVPILQCKRDVVGVRKRRSRRKGFNSEDVHRHGRRNQVLGRARQAARSQSEKEQG
jgi:hypothetical protein